MRCKPKRATPPLPPPAPALDHALVHESDGDFDVVNGQIAHAPHFLIHDGGVEVLAPRAKNRTSTWRRRRDAILPTSIKIVTRAEDDENQVS